MRWALATGRTPSELLASISSTDLVEMIAYSNLEPWGPLHEDFRAGQICATVANVNRDPKARSDPWRARDFFPALNRFAEMAERKDGPIFLEDPEAMSALIMQNVFRRDAP